MKVKKAVSGGGPAHTHTASNASVLIYNIDEIVHFIRLAREVPDCKERQVEDHRPGPRFVMPDTRATSNPAHRITKDRDGLFTLL